MERILLKYDCKYFSGDRPCFYHKNHKIVCDNCTNYSPIKNKILIIKLDAIGDVLRTTSILKPLRDKYPDYHITWLTRKNAKDLFHSNKFVDEVLTLDSETDYFLRSLFFDIVINLDNSKLSASITSSINSKKKIGFVLDKKGYVLPTNSNADYWLNLSAFDTLKKQNQLTYQEIMYSILDFNSKVERPVLVINDNNADFIVNKLKLDKSKTIIGLNIGVGPKWPNKGWPLKRWEELIYSLSNHNYELLLLVGPDEKDLNEYLTSKFNFLRTSGCNNSLIEFAEIISICDLVVTCDSLALHICTALNKKTIVLFGPTSSNEIELYGNGIKISADDECKCFYNRKCTEQISCMEKISTEKVLNSFSTLLDK